MMTPTPAGRYRVAGCARHSSTGRYKAWSMFRWGSPMKDEGGKVFVMHDGKWTDVAVVGITRAEILDSCWKLYRLRTVTPTWVFNDFGHITCYLYRDTNNNARQDANERTLSEMLHPDPVNEARAFWEMPAKLDVSHGCVHLKPADIDDMINRKFMRKNNLVVVHPYSEMRIAHGKDGLSHCPPYELHFYPGLQLMIVLGTEKL